MEQATDLAYLSDADLEPLLKHANAVQKGKFRRGLAKLVEENPLAGLITPIEQAKLTERLREKYYHEQAIIEKSKTRTQTADWSLKMEL